MRAWTVIGRALLAVVLVSVVVGGTQQGASAEGEGDDGPRSVEVDGAHAGHGRGGLDLPGLGGGPAPDGVDYPCWFHRPVVRGHDPTVPLVEAEDLTVAMLFGGVIEWTDVVASPRSVWPLVVGRPYFRACYPPGHGPADGPPAFTDEFCYRSPCGSTGTVDELVEHLRATVDPGAPIPVASPPLDSLVAGVETRFGVGQLLVPMTHTPEETGVLGLGASITATPVRVEWAVDGEVFLTCEPAESMIGAAGTPRCAHTFSTSTGGPVEGSVTVTWTVEAELTRAGGAIESVDLPAVVERTDVTIAVREIEALVR